MPTPEQPAKGGPLWSQALGGHPSCTPTKPALTPCLAWFFGLLHLLIQLMKLKSARSSTPAEDGADYRDQELTARI